MRLAKYVFLLVFVVLLAGVAAVQLGASAPQTASALQTSALQAAATSAPAQIRLQEDPAAALTLAAGADVETAIYETVYEQVNPSVVYIENQAQLSGGRNTTSLLLPGSSGSGFVWDAQGHIVTNNHVVAGADRLEVTFADGVALPAELVATDPDSDLAVIQVDPDLIELTPVAQGDIEDVRVGSRAIAIGNPYGLVGTMTTGIVSAIGRSLASDPDSATSFSIPQVLQTDAAMNPGNSGGPLLNELGEVIGVNFQIRSETGASSGVGFAIPINIVQRVVPALIEDGDYEHAYLGIRGGTYTPAWAAALDLPEDVRGAYVTEVLAGGPADRAGVVAGDTDTDLVLGISMNGPVYLQGNGDLITAIDGEPVKTFEDLLVYLENNRSPGDEVELTVLRAGGKEVTLTLTLGSRPD